MIELIVAFSMLIFTVMGYIIWNLLRKVEIYEDLGRRYSDLFIQLKKVIDNSNQHLKEIDERGSFKSDDEIGWFFVQIQHIQDTLNKFNEIL